MAVGWSEERGRSPHDPPPLFPSHPTIDDYERAAAYFRTVSDAVAVAEFEHLREVALVGARLGTIRPAELVRRVRPAAVTVTLLMEPELETAGGTVVRAILRGDVAGARYWARMVSEADGARGSLAALVKGKPDPGTGRGAGARGWWRSVRHDLTEPNASGRQWRAANVVLALAPPLAAVVRPWRRTAKFHQPPCAAASANARCACLSRPL